MAGSKKVIYPGDVLLWTRRIHVAANTTKLDSLASLASKVRTIIVNQRPHSSFTMLGYHIADTVSVPPLRSGNNVPGLGQSCVTERDTRHLFWSC